MTTAIKTLAHILIAQLLGRLSVALLVALAPVTASATSFNLQNYGTTVIGNSVSVNANFLFALPEDVKAALDRGVSLIFITDIEVYNPVDYLPDDTFVRINLRKRLSYHALTSKYTVDDLTFGHRNSYQSIEAALAEIGHVRSVRLLDSSIARSNKESIVRLRLNLALGELPFPLRLQAMVLPDWYITSPWFAWKLN